MVYVPNTKRLLLGNQRPSAVSTASLNTGLISFWKLDDLSDSGGTNTLTNNHAATFVAGHIGNCVSLNGVNQSLSHASNASLQTGDVDWSISGWFFEASGAPGGSLVSKTDGGQATLEYAVAVGGGTIFFQIGDAGGSVEAITTLTYAEDAWQFFCVQYNHATKILSASVNNGTSTTLDVSDLTIVTGNNRFTIGDDADGGSPYTGQIDAVGFWKKVLTPTEIGLLYASGAGIEPPF